MEIDRSFTSSAPARQGDLIARANFEQRHCFDRFGVIVTADCDMERARPDHQLTFLRIVPVAEYMMHIWCRRKLHDLTARLRNDTASLFNRLSQENEPTWSSMTSDQLADWLSSSSAQEICDTLSSNKVRKSDIEKLSIRLGEMQFAGTTANISPSAPALDPFIYLRARKKKVEIAKMRDDVLQQAKNELSKESDEIFFLSRLVPDEQSEGYYVMLDHIGTLRRDQLFDYKSEADLTPEGAHRFGRLQNTFKYAVVQRFAFLFQRIGLPDERIDLHKSALQKIG